MSRGGRKAHSRICVATAAGVDPSPGYDPGRENKHGRAYADPAALTPGAHHALAECAHLPTPLRRRWIADSLHSWAGAILSV